MLHSDVELVARLSIAARAGDPFAIRSLPDSLLSAALDQIVNEVLIAREADRVRGAHVGSRDLEREWGRLEQSLGGPSGVRSFLHHLGADEAELRQVAARRALVAAFLRAHLDGGEVVTEAEVERIYASGEHPFDGRPLEEVREPLRAHLRAERLEAAVARWVRVLRGRTSVRITAPYGRRTGRAPVAVYPEPSRG
ncbi:MAG: hypothetical protein H5U40_00855 [Polyangiaceae bacterium]|nr:hypothetical protein [Polyangiaceae bacterium]